MYSREVLLDRDLYILGTPKIQMNFVLLLFWGWRFLKNFYTISNLREIFFVFSWVKQKTKFHECKKKPVKITKVYLVNCWKSFPRLSAQSSFHELFGWNGVLEIVFFSSEMTINWLFLRKILWKMLMPYPCTHFYFDIKFGDRLYSFEYNLSPNLISK